MSQLKVRRKPGAPPRTRVVIVENQHPPDPHPAHQAHAPQAGGRPCHSTSRLASPCRQVALVEQTASFAMPAAGLDPYRLAGDYAEVRA
jgi:hypothetical protein